MRKNNLLQITFLLTTTYLLSVDLFCMRTKKSFTHRAIEAVTKPLLKTGGEELEIAIKTTLGLEKTTEGKKTKDKIILSSKEKAIKAKRETKERLKKDVEADEKLPQEQRKSLEIQKTKLKGFIRKAIVLENLEESIDQKGKKIKKAEKKRAKLTKLKDDAEEEAKKSFDTNIKAVDEKINKLKEEMTQLESKQEKEEISLSRKESGIEKYLTKEILEETEEESGGLSGIKKTGLATLATGVTGGLATGTTSALAGTAFAASQGMQEDDEGVFLDTEEAGDDETISEDEVQGEEEITQEPTEEKAVKIVAKEPAGSIIGELISGAKEVAGDIVETAAISMATGEQKEGMLEKVKEDEKREAAEKQKTEKKKTEAKKQEKKSSFVPLDSGTSADKKVKKKPVEEKKVDEKKDKQEKIAAKEEVLKVISLPEDMELTSKQAESLLSILADHAGKVLKKSSKLFSNDEKKKTFTTVSGETIGVVGKDFSKEYIDKYQSTLDLYKKARDEYKALLKKKRVGQTVDEDQLKSSKRYYEEMKDKARTAFIEKRDAINNKALYYQPDGSASAFKIIQEGVKIIQKHTPENFETIDLLEIFPYLKDLDIESKDILPTTKTSDKQDDRDIEKELFVLRQAPADAKAMADTQDDRETKKVTKRLKQEQRDVEERLSKEKEDIELLRKKRDQEFEAAEERLKREKEDVEVRRQETDKELEEFGKRQSFWN